MASTWMINRPVVVVNGKRVLAKAARVEQPTPAYHEDAGQSDPYTIMIETHDPDDLITGDEHRLVLKIATDAGARRRREREEATAREREATEGYAYGQFIDRLLELEGEERRVAMYALADWLEEQRADELAHAYRWAASRDLWPRLDPFTATTWIWIDSEGARPARLPAVVASALTPRPYQTVGVAFYHLADALQSVANDLRVLPRD